jgi:hypothetical protein
MWFLYKKVLLTNDNLAKIRWNECTYCVFCGSKETIDHLFISLNPCISWTEANQYSSSFQDAKMYYMKQHVYLVSKISAE